ncbi:MAG: HNH endonuclease signature motif containing protein [Phycisphaerales bacterium]
MPGIPFKSLAERFVNALELAGTTVVVHSADDTRPLVLSVVIDGKAQHLEVYLWAVTSGGKGRNRPNERRIQMTGVERFTLKAGVRTIVGGWSDEAGVYAFWDVRRHLTFTAGSPSLQISLETLEKACGIGMAAETRTVREGDETAIAVHPDFLLWYVQEYERLYDCGREIDEADSLVEAPPEREREFIDSGRGDAEQSRRHQVVSIVRNFRDARFRPLVLRAYSYRCCLTGVALRLVDAAHIVPVSDPTSTDEPSNGVALNPLLHRAYDAGLLGLLPGGRTAINKRLLDGLRRQRLDSGFDIVERMIPPVMAMPGMPELRPSDDHFRRGLRARGWSETEIAAP